MTKRVGCEVLGVQPEGDDGMSVPHDRLARVLPPYVQVMVPDEFAVDGIVLCVTLRVRVRDILPGAIP